MKPFLMLVAVVAAGFSMAGCHHRREVFVPNTVEGNACKRECMQVEQTCRNARGNKRHTCEKQADECLLTCPGASY